MKVTRFFCPSATSSVSQSATSAPTDRPTGRPPRPVADVHLDNRTSLIALRDSLPPPALLFGFFPAPMQESGRWRRRGLMDVSALIPELNKHTLVCNHVHSRAEAAETWTSLVALRQNLLTTGLACIGSTRRPHMWVGNLEWNGSAGFSTSPDGLIMHRKNSNKSVRCAGPCRKNNPRQFLHCCAADFGPPVSAFDNTQKIGSLGLLHGYGKMCGGSGSERASLCSCTEKGDERTI